MRRLKIVFIGMMLGLNTLLISSPTSNIDQALEEYRSKYAELRA